MSRHRFHGDPARFEVVAEFVAGRFPDARYVADVAGGQGMLTRLLRKRYGYEAELIDPRGWSLKGVPVRVEDFDASMADYYDLVIGLHPDEALRSVVQSAGRTATLVVPCCNFWFAETKLGRDELIEQIIDFHNQRGGKSEHIVLDFRGPKNHALILLPPAGNVRLQAKARFGADHLDQVAQEAHEPGAVKGAEHVRFRCVREPGRQLPILG